MQDNGRIMENITNNTISDELIDELKALDILAHLNPLERLIRDLTESIEHENRVSNINNSLN